ncbi:MAG TPA: hypothetical protein ENK57_03200 [Polyangiaceae bacterium]|nr:hypothetical protein [Polyangiaceae bacterium]
MAAVETRAQRLRESPRHLALELLELARTTGDKVLLFVDQLEELFTLVDPEEKQSFLDAIAHGADDLQDPVRIVLTIRHDFVDRLAAVGGAASPLARFFALKSPDRRMLEVAVREPVERVGYAFEDEELVEQMIAAVQGEPAALALLQFAAERLWDERDEERKLLTRSAYEAMGGVGGALARHADAQLNTLAPSQERIATTLLQRLVTPARTRRLVPRDEALAGLGRDAESVLERLTEARLVSVIKLHRGEAPRVELTHDSLIHTWQTLGSIVERGEDEHRLVEEASQAADLWAKRGRRPEELWRGQALRDAERHLSRAQLPQPVMEFLRASDHNEQQLATRRRLVTIGSIAALAAIAAVAIIASLVIVRQRAEEEAAKQEAVARAVGAERLAATEALIAARAALQRRDPAAAREHLARALIAHDHPGARLLWHELEHTALRTRVTGITDPSPTPRRSARRGKLIAKGATLTLDEDGTLHRRNEGDDAPRIWRDDVRLAAADPETPDVAVVDDDGVVLLSTRSTSAPRVVSAPRSTIHDVAVAPGRLAVWTEGAVLAGHPHQLHPLDVPHAVESIAFDEDGLLVLSGDGQRSWWDVTRAPLRRPGPSTIAHAVASIEDAALATVDGSGTWRRLEGGRVTRAHSSGLSRVDAVAMTPDGRVVAALAHRALALWRPGAPRRIIDGDSDATVLAIGTDGRLAAATPDRIALWDAEGKRTTSAIVVGPTITAVALDGERLVVADSSGRVTPWNGTKRGEPLPLAPAPVTALALRGDTLAVARPERIDVVALSSGRERTLPIARATALAIDHRGAIIVGATDGSVDRIDARDGRPIGGAIGLMPDGELITTPSIGASDSKDAPRWVRAARREGALARQLADGAPLCMLTTRGELAIWSTGADRPMGKYPIAGLVDVVGLPSACAARSAGAVLLSSGAKPQPLVETSPSAIGWAEQRLLVAAGGEILTFSESGERLESHDFAGDRASAVTQMGSTIVVGHDDGRLTWLETVDGSARTFTGGSTRAATALVAGPSGAVVAGYEDGVIVIQGDDGARLWRAELDGAVTHLRFDGTTLAVATRRGDRALWSFEELDQERCALLAELNADVSALGSVTGQAMVRPELPHDHPCRTTR